MLKFWKFLNELYGWLLILVSLFIILIGCWQVYDNYYTFYHTIDDKIVMYKPKPDAPPEEQAATPITDEMVGWITVNGTSIDYPVMQGETNSHFLNTDPFGHYSLSGSIFLDSRCSGDFSDAYSVIYGHHMDYGKMFGALDAFLDAPYLRTHSSGTLIVGRNAEKTYSLKIFAAMRVNARDKVVFDIKQDEIRQYIHDRADILTAEKDERILALSTCADADSMTRIVVFCYILPSIAK